MRIAFILGLVAFVSETVACDCHIRTLSQNQAQSYERATLILVGYVAHIDTAAGTYQVDVVELLKGETSKKRLNGITPTSCSGFPNIGLWIIYAFIHPTGQIEFDHCGMSRSFLDPQFVMITDYAPPLPPRDPQSSKYTDAILEASRQILSLKEKALDDLKRELTELRKRR